MPCRTVPTERPTGELARRLSRVRYVISDVDGTMYARGGKALTTADGRPSAELPITLVALREAGIEVIPCTGRSRAMVREDARTLDLNGWIAELGGVLCTVQASQSTWCYFTGDMDYDPSCGKTPHDIIMDNGVIQRILDRWHGHVEMLNDNGKGYAYREVNVGMRGIIDVEEAQDMLDACGLPLYLTDNGILNHISGECLLDADCPRDRLHGYHVLEKGLSKGTGVARFIELKGWDPSEVLGAGDSPADIEMAGFVGTFLFMRSGLANPGAAEELALHDNIIVSNHDTTDGWCECMRAVLAAKGLR